MPHPTLKRHINKAWHPGPPSHAPGARRHVTACPTEPPTANRAPTRALAAATPTEERVRSLAAHAGILHLPRRCDEKDPRLDAWSSQLRPLIAHHPWWQVQPLLFTPSDDPRTHQARCPDSLDGRSLPAEERGCQRCAPARTSSTCSEDVSQRNSTKATFIRQQGSASGQQEERADTFSLLLSLSPFLSFCRQI